ncbi:uncharacterized protein LOC141912942 [Tubulanus polymorphus]|uniref:uncharacterized protein LOC141912942 n=1 Tax=Tubulanus polymorphus TaxID=672921 RepID=UPI003DA2D694
MVSKTGLAVFAVVFVVGSIEAFNQEFASKALDGFAELAVRRANDALESHISKRGISSEEQQLMRSLRMSFKISLGDVLKNVTGKVKQVIAEKKQDAAVLVDKLKGLVGKVNSKAKLEVLELIEKLKSHPTVATKLNQIQEILDGLKDQVTDKTLTHLMVNGEQYGLFDTMKGLFNKLGSKFSSFRDWMKSKLSVAWEASQPVVEIIKEMAVTFISAAGGYFTEKALEEAIKFFDEHKEEIGLFLWEQVQIAFQQMTAG